MWLCQRHYSNDVSPVTLVCRPHQKLSALLDCRDDRWFNVGLYDSRMVSRVFNVEIIDTRHSPISSSPLPRSGWGWGGTHPDPSQLARKPPPTSPLPVGGTTPLRVLRASLTIRWQYCQQQKTKIIIFYSRKRASHKLTSAGRGRWKWLAWTVKLQK